MKAILIALTLWIASLHPAPIQGLKGGHHGHRCGLDPMCRYVGQIRAVHVGTAIHLPLSPRERMLYDARQAALRYLTTTTTTAAKS